MWCRCRCRCPCPAPSPTADKGCPGCVRCRTVCAGSAGLLFEGRNHASIATAASPAPSMANRRSQPASNRTRTNGDGGEGAPATARGTPGSEARVERGGLVLHPSVTLCLHRLCPRVHHLHQGVHLPCLGVHHPHQRMHCLHPGVHQLLPGCTAYAQGCITCIKGCNTHIKGCNAHAQGSITYSQRSIPHVQGCIILPSHPPPCQVGALGLHSPCSLFPSSVLPHWIPLESTTGIFHLNFPGRGVLGAAQGPRAPHVPGPLPTPTITSARPS